MIRRPFLPAILILCLAQAAYADWRSVGPGVDYQEFADASTDIHVARIDLTNDDIRVIATRESERGLKVSDYAKKNKALVAINGDYFDDRFHPIGLTIGPCGQWAGTKDTKREGVVAVAAGRADVRTQAEEMDPPENWIDTAISGWPMLVRNGEPLGPKELPGSDVFTRSPHPRTAVGVSRDHKTLYLVVADGRRTGVPGLTLAQLAQFMVAQLDVYAAINLDGGGSSTMWIGSAVVNRPSDGVERKVSDHLAVVLADGFVECTQSDRLAALRYGQERSEATAAAMTSSTSSSASSSTPSSTATTPSPAAAITPPATGTTGKPASPPRK